MATIEILRPEANPPPLPSVADAAVAEPAPAAAAPTPVAPEPAVLAAFRSGREEERLAELLAFALAVAAGEAAAPSAATVERHRRQAERELHDHAFRFLHNRVEDIRREAAAEHAARQPRPPGLLKLVLANLAAIAVAAAALAWAAGHPELLDRVRAALGI
jgi:hypothetical protein